MPPASATWIALSAAAMTLAWSGCYSLVRSARRRPVGAVIALSAALLICLEAVLLHLLSPWSAVGRIPLLLGNVGISAAGLFLPKRSPLRIAPPLRFVAAQARLSWVAPLGLLAAVAAVEWVPNNWDSMTYHLARVAYWLQYRSVAPYPTNIDRQIGLPPGAEYLMLSLQAIAGTDRLDNLVQFAAWLSLVLSAPPLARAFGAPRKAASWAGVLVGTLPLGLLQASSTQNDLVAALMAAAIVAACLPFIHLRRNWRGADVALLACAGGAGVLVKPTSLVAAAPFLFWALYAGVRSLRKRRDQAGLIQGLALAAVVLIAALGPAMLARLSLPDPGSITRPFVYAGVAEPVDRMLNSLRGLARSLPLPEALERAIAPENTMGCPAPGRLCVDNAFRLNEDFAGNVGQALLVGVALLLGVLWWRGLPRRSRLALAGLPTAWLLFHGVFRHNVFYSRIQLPLFGLGGLALVCFGTRPGHRQRNLGALRPLAILLAAYGALAVCRNETREPTVVPEEVRFAGSAAAYYFSASRGLQGKHDTVLAALRATGCRKLGMFIGGDSYDYPLAWRAMQAGVEVHHVVEPDDWPCLVFTDRGPPPPRLTGQWKEVNPSLYLAR